MLHQDPLAARVIAVLTQRLGIPPEAVTLTAQLAEDLGVDSVDAVELVVALEQHFDITLPETVLTDVKTVQDVVDLVREHFVVPSEEAPDRVG
jgi:acyl carrier protein